ncbi:MAG: right-handed parallel beta-helix repeat-containing protein [Draconibacterium sp.]|nr:right-handed parallel beta-helix repeat-containing protein [Draconibacterium sp.]
MSILHIKQYLLKCLIVITFILLTFVVNGTNYYVSSSSGNDLNPGTSEDLAWKSIERVNNFYKLYPGDQVLFKRGDEWTGNLRVNLSGTKENPITFGSYGIGNNPKINGSEIISGWTLHSGNIYKATFNKIINQLFLNDSRINVARLPDKDYFDITVVNSSASFTSSNLDNNINYKGAKWIGRTSTYSMVTLNVTSSNGKTITLAEAPYADLNIKEGFFLVGKLEFLDSPGEWYYDSATKTVYVWTLNNDSPENYVVRGSVYDYGVEIKEKENVIIKDFEFLHYKIAGISLLRSSNIIIDGNIILSPDSYGIYAALGSNNTIINNTITGANHIGIQLIESNSIISDNKVNDTFLLKNLGLSGAGEWYMGSGIYVEGDDNLITYNRVVNSGYNGIHFNYRNIVEYNYILNSLLTKDDGGAIYTSSFNSYPNAKTAGSIVRYNVIDGSLGTLNGFGYYGFRQGFGIYLDENAGGVTIEYNTISNCSAICIGLHKSFDATIMNNTLINAKTLFNVNSDLGGSKFTNNILYALNRNIDNDGVQLLVGKYKGNVKLDSNLYINHYNNTNIFKLDENSNLNFTNWKVVANQDVNSKFDNSKLINGFTEKLIYNDTKLSKTYNTGNSTYYDVYGNKISGTFTLKPFTSIILIGKDFEKINQSPTILDQSINFSSPKVTNDTIGKINANDPDSLQLLFYTIIQGNENGWFSIDKLTGTIYAKTDIQTSIDLSFDLLISVTDSTVNFLSDTAKVVINISGYDTSPPIITTFSILPQYISLKVPVTSLTATDDVAVFGFMLTETPESPQSNDNNWLIIAPKEFTFSKVGTLILYAWAKDSTGNISESKSDTVYISLPDMSPTFSEYLYEENTGTLIIDSKGYNNGTISDEIIRNEGIIGNVLKFTGSGFIDLGQSFGENVENEISLSTWIKPAGTSNGENQGIILHGGPNNYSFALYLNYITKSISFNTTGTTNPVTTINNINELWDGNWHHLLVTYNGLEKIIYLDNVVLSRISTTGKIDSGWGYNLFIGTGTSEINPTLLYEGMIDETRIYNYALNSDEIRELYDSVNRIYKKISTTEFISICEGEEYFGWTESGQYERVLKRKLDLDSGADSIVITHLSVNQIYQNIIEATICEGEKIILGTQELTLPGEYTEVFNTINGCDSTTYIKLNVIPKITTIETINICEGENYILGTQTLSASGEYSEVYKSVSGCDSIKTIILIVNPGYIINEDITISVDDNYFGWSEEGIYQRILTTKTGCDSIVVTNLKVVHATIQKINLEKGWNIFSSYIIPLNEDITTVFDKLRTEGQLIKVQDENENMYEELENQIGWVNNIGNFQKTEGYKIRVENDCELEVTGVKINLPLNIALQKGLNLISFPMERSIDAMQIFEPLINSGILKKVQDERGNAVENWAKIGWINGIGSLQAGEGYIVQVNENGILTMNNISEKSNQNIVDIPKPEHFKVNYEGNGYGHMNINVIDFNKSLLKIGDEIAVFDKNKCVGAIKLNESHFNSNRISLAASSAETNINDGFHNGNIIDFRIWNKEKNQETKLLPEVIDGDLIYNKQASVFIRINEVSDFDKNISIYPNPASGYVQIRFLSLPEYGAEIQLLDVTGKQIINRKLQSNLEVINIENLPVGVYFIKTSIKSQSNTTKLIVI